MALRRKPIIIIININIIITIIIVIITIIVLLLFLFPLYCVYGKPSAYNVVNIS
jgi:hypothetical protein